eukprot:COSAG02_NODE_6948_length_3269_cov_2.137855_3_plen_38_part_00
MVYIIRLLELGGGWWVLTRNVSRCALLARWLGTLRVP